MFWSASLWKLTQLKDKSVVWVEPMLGVLGDSNFWESTLIATKIYDYVSIIFISKYLDSANGNLKTKIPKFGYILSKHFPNITLSSYTGLSTTLDSCEAHPIHVGSKMGNYN